jgi:hypothetical protein
LPIWASCHSRFVSLPNHSINTFCWTNSSMILKTFPWQSGHLRNCHRQRRFLHVCNKGLSNQLVIADSNWESWLVQEPAFMTIVGHLDNIGWWTAKQLHRKNHSSINIIAQFELCGIGG